MSSKNIGRRNSRFFALERLAVYVFVEGRKFLLQASRTDRDARILEASGNVNAASIAVRSRPSVADRPKRIGSNFLSDLLQNEIFPANIHGSDGCHQHLLAMSPIVP